MIPVTQFILGNSDPLLYPSEKMTNSIDEQMEIINNIDNFNFDIPFIGGGNISKCLKVLLHFGLKM